MDGTIIGQGTFTVGATVVPVAIKIPSNADWMKVLNYTQMGTDGTIAAGVEFYWQRGMAQGTGVVKYKSSTTDVNILNGDTLASGGFTLYDPSANITSGGLAQYGTLTAITTGVSSATRPVVTTTNTSGLVAASSSAYGSVVRIISPGFPSNGIDFTVGAVSANTSFTLLSAAGALANAPGAAGTLGNYQVMNYDPLYYPRNRYIANITRATQGVVSTTVPHGLTPGQAIRFNIPANSGMTQLNATPGNNYLYATVVSISSTDANIFTIDINTTNFTPFTWPTSGQREFPEMTPIGENTALALLSPTIQIPGVSSPTLGQQINDTNSGILADSTVNTGFLGMVLGTGGNGVGLAAAITGPAGTAASDVMYWVAGKSTYDGL